jgi:hypothetical protein
LGVVNPTAKVCKSRAVNERTAGNPMQTVSISAPVGMQFKVTNVPDLSISLSGGPRLGWEDLWAWTRFWVPRNPWWRIFWTRIFL